MCRKRYYLTCLSKSTLKLIFIYTNCNFKYNNNNLLKSKKRIGAMYRGSSLLPIKYRNFFANALILPHFYLNFDI